LSGTLEIEAENRQKQKDYEQRMRELNQDNERLDRIILQTRNETEQIEKENDRLAELESKIDLLFCKYGINLPLARRPKQP
jgi:TolA-binding protein